MPLVSIQQALVDYSYYPKLTSLSCVTEKLALARKQKLLLRYRSKS